MAEFIDVIYLGRMFSTAQLSDFARDGYLVVPGVVDADGCHAAIARIECLIHERPPPAGHTGHHFYWETAGSEPLLMGMLTQTAAWECAAELVAPLELKLPPGVQVALTFPPFDHRPGRGHIDGLTPPLKNGRPGTFTLLAGIALSDQTRDGMGNLFVWPGSHRLLAQYLHDQGADAIVSIEGYPPIECGEPVQVHASPGDLILASYLLSHNIGGNVSPMIRKTLYFRLHVAGHEENWRQAVTDEMHEFPLAVLAKR